MNESQSAIRQYLIVTGNYWAFTLTDGALRMLVVLHFHQLGYSPLAIAMLFLFYEFFGIVTNLIGGWLGARIGLNNTMNLGLLLQIIALGMLLVPSEYLIVAWVMSAQALSGIAKDLNKMSAKSAIKTLIPDHQQGRMYKWVALLTGSKNTLKGVGFFLGGLLLTLLGFQGAVLCMTLFLIGIMIGSLFMLKKDLGKSKSKPRFKHIFSKNRSLNLLSAARLFLFCARDVWFVVALPVFLAEKLDWNHWMVGGFLATWVIFYGLTQSIAPLFTKRANGATPTAQTAAYWTLPLSLVPFLIAIALSQLQQPEVVLVIGLALFGLLFAINSSLHSFLIIRLADRDTVSLDVGFYYMANAAGRLFGTVLSGVAYQLYGLNTCLYLSSFFLVLAILFVRLIPKNQFLTHD